jgi:hypothetical protein
MLWPAPLIDGFQPSTSKLQELAAADRAAQRESS